MSSSESTPLHPLNESSAKNGVLKGFILGQSASAVRAGFWWVALAPLTLALFDHNAMILAAARLLFNLALLITSPAAASAVERASVRQVLIWTTFGRIVIYAILLPLAYLLLKTDYLFDKSLVLSDTFFTVAFLVLLTLDGILVSFCNVVDVDCGGADILARQHSISLTDTIRGKFNSLHVASFEGSMVVLPPVIAAVLFALRDKFTSVDLQRLSLLGALGVSFLVCGVLSIFSYVCFIPKGNRDDEIPDIDIDGEASWHSTRELWGNIVEGLGMTWRHKPLFWRLLFLGLETSFEDAVISIFVPLYAVYALGSLETILNAGQSVAAINFGTYNYVAVFFWASVISSVGKLGTLASASLMSKYWLIPDPDELGLETSEASELERKTFSPLFKYVLLSGIATGVFPLAWHLWVYNGYFSGSQIVLFFGLFLFFSLSTVPKIGFQALIQSLATSLQSSDKIFGFVGTFVTLCDCIVFFAFAALFSYVGFELALIIGSSVIVFNGLLEVILGPRWILPKRASSNSHQGYQVIN